MIPYFEILDKGKVTKRFRLSLSDISYENELMSIPTITITNVPEIIPYLRGRKDIKIHTELRTFYGTTTGVSIETANGTVSIQISHVVNEWNYRQVPTNFAIKQKNVPQVYVSEELKYSDEWQMLFDSKSSEDLIDYVYSRQSKLDALTKTCELTQDLFWRVPFTKDKRIEVGAFGEEKPYVVSLLPSSKHNVRILEEPQLEEDFSSVINMATVYSEKNDNGMTSLTLREVYNDKGLQDDNFPVVILGNNINNERDYQYVEFPKLAPNNQLEYAILDTESVAMESGIFIEGTFAFNDLSPFSLEDTANTPSADGSSWVVPSEQRYLTDEEKLNNARCIYNQLRGLWTDTAIASMIGCASMESTLNPNIFQNLDQYSLPLQYEGYGLVGWTPYTRITEWLKQHGYELQDYGVGEVNKIIEEWESGTTNAEWIPTSQYPFTFKQWSAMNSDMTTMCMAWMVNYGRGDTRLDLKYGDRINYGNFILEKIRNEWSKDTSGTVQEKEEQDVSKNKVWSPSNFVNKYLNTGQDVDGVAGNQCVDTFKLALKELGDPNYTRPIGGDGWAHSIWYNKEQYSDYFTFHTTDPQYGDFAIFGRGGDTPSSHVAMYMGGKKFFGQNQPLPSHNIVELDRTYILGYLRVRSEFWTRTPNWSETENTNGVREVSDADRIYAGVTVYNATVKKLKNARRKFQISVKTEQLPKDLNVGDKIKFKYDMTEWHIEECSNYMRKMIELDDWWYITKIGFDIDNTGIETGTLTLEKFLRIDREGNKETTQ